jgi:hypothetical protein
LSKALPIGARFLTGIRLREQQYDEGVSGHYTAHPLTGLSRSSQNSVAGIRTPTMPSAFHLPALRSFGFYLDEAQRSEPLDRQQMRCRRLTRAGQLSTLSACGTAYSLHLISTDLSHKQTIDPVPFVVRRRRARRYRHLETYLVRKSSLISDPNGKRQMRSSTELMPMLVTAFIAAVGIGSLILMNIDSRANIHGVGVTMISAYLVEKAGATMRPTEP